MSPRGISGTPEYMALQAAIQRCHNPNSQAYRNYGARGITVCDRWRNSFEAFLADVGLRPEGMSLDRIDNNGNYEPGNCRWATDAEQRANKRPLATCRAGHPYTPENTRLRNRASGKTTRQCITCAQAREASRPPRPGRKGSDRRGRTFTCPVCGQKRHVNSKRSHLSIHGVTP